MQNWRNHITADPAILAGKPIIKGTRISLEWIIELYAKGMDEASILDNYPQLTNEDLRAVFLYVIDSMQYQSLFTHVPKAA